MGDVLPTKRLGCLDAEERGHPALFDIDESDVGWNGEWRIQSESLEERHGLMDDEPVDDVVALRRMTIDGNGLQQVRKEVCMRGACATAKSDSFASTR